MQPIKVTIQPRIQKFVKTFEESENELVRYVVRNVATSSESILGRNIRTLNSKMSKTYEEMLELSSKSVKEILFEIWNREINEDYIYHADVIKELLLVKENLLTVDFGSHRLMDIISCDIIINNLCVS